MIPQVDESLYLDYANEPEDYSSEKWYKNLISVHKNTKESDEY